MECRAVCLLLFMQAGLLAYSATRHSPTNLEPAFLASGLSHWQFHRFELYRVNPPLVRVVAAIPVLLVGGNTDWSDFQDSPGSRAEFPIGHAFLRVNGADSIRLFFYARWVCIPFNLIGAYFAYRWAQELYDGKAGIFTLVLYVFEPNLLAHGELVTPDGATTALGIAAGYAFWRWLKQPTWSRAGLAGLALGLAELCKFTWLILFGVWPVIWLVWLLLSHPIQRSPATLGENQKQGTSTSDKPTAPRAIASDHQAAEDSRPPFFQLATILLLGVYLINLGYSFDGFCTPLNEFQFVSKSLTGRDKSGLLGNRFRDTWMGAMPVPLPKQYIMGIDSQRKDLEEYRLPSYLRGEIKEHGGWWYYYLYGLLVKVPCGTWGLFILVVLTRVICRSRPVPLRDELVLLLPAMVLLNIVSITEFNQHLRYVFPALGLLLIFVGQAGLSLANGRTVFSIIAVGLLAQSVFSLAMVYPHHLSYFNAIAGGPARGHQHLLGSSLDWGQDLLFLRDHVQATGQVVDDIRGSYINRHLMRAVVPNYASRSATGPRIIVISPNCLQVGGRLPEDGQMLTPALWIERLSDDSQ